MKLSEILTEMRITGKTSLDTIRRRFKGKSEAKKKKRFGKKTSGLSKGKSGFGRPPRQKEIRR